MLINARTYLLTYLLLLLLLMFFDFDEDVALLMSVAGLGLMRQ